MQVGEAEVTLEVGKAALADSKAGPFKRDILLAMALAHCTLASSAFSTQDQASSCHQTCKGQCMSFGCCALWLALMCNGLCLQRYAIGLQ